MTETHDARDETDHARGHHLVHDLVEHLVETLDRTDQKIASFKHDVSDGVHTAIFDEASMLHPVGHRDEETLTTQDCPDDAPDGTCWDCGAHWREPHKETCATRHKW